MWEDPEGYWSWFALVPWNHLVDIGVMWFLAYQVYMRFRGTQAMRLLVRLFIVWLGYMAAQSVGLNLTAFLLWALWIAGLIFFLITFQREIQRILMRINPMRPMAAILRVVRKVSLPDEEISAAVESAFRLASRRIGAIMVWERRDPLEPHLRNEGEIIDAELRPALVETLFVVGAPYHDGAVYIHDNKIYRAGCVLPLAENSDLAAHYGTRHRAAAGITERSDAIAVVVSEERGEVSAVEDGRLIAMSSHDELASWLTSRLRAGEEDARSRWKNLQESLHRNWRVKITSLAIVVVLWGLALKQRENPRNLFTTLGPGVEETFVIPVEYYNIPEGLALEKDRLKEISVRLKGKDDVLSFLDKAKIRAMVNLEGAEEGIYEQTISRRNITLPGDVLLTAADPSEIEVRLEKISPNSVSAQKNKKK